jgi:Cys-rich four helix bundle protein (predicted Tat secretion target)
MDTRRSFLAKSGLALGTSILGTRIFAQTQKVYDHGHHNKHGAGKGSDMSTSLIELQKSVDHCLDVGKTCVAHCNALLAGGDKEMASCQMAVMNMLSVTQAVSEISHYNSFKKVGFSQLVKACMELCKDCESECKKHADMHSECKDCMEACQRCIKSCQTYLKS